MISNHEFFSEFNDLKQNSRLRSNYKNEDLLNYRNRIKDMFYHAYNNYVNNAYPFDELKPITCKGFDTWGSYSLTLIDSLDMLIILDNRTEFERVSNLLEKSINFDKDINVSVFETNIRVIGGLISAHLLSYRLYLDKSSNVLNVTNKLHPEWPCDGPLLRLALKAADKLLPAFDTPTGMPFGTVNLKNGVPKGETAETCVAGVGTFLIEFSVLSRLTGDDRYEKAALKALDSLWNLRSPIDLIGNHINVESGKWTGVDATIGSGVDSYFEYLVKGGLMLNRPDLLEQFRTYQRAIEKYLFYDNWFFWANMNKGQKTLPLFSSLEAFYPGLLTLTGDLKQAVKIIDSYNYIWRQYGSLPEFFNIQTNNIHNNREAYPLRPELIESLMYIIRATDDDSSYIQMAVDYLESIDRISRLDCGFATIKDVKDHKLEDRMESFFLAETLKYLYLIFDKDNFLHNDVSSNSYKIIQNSKGECLIETGFFFFNTEAHPVDGGALECCRVMRLEEKENKHEALDLFNHLDVNHLINKVVRLNANKNNIYVPNDNFTVFKTIKDEYEDMSFKLKLEKAKNDKELSEYCKNKKSNNDIQTKDEKFKHILNAGHTYPFTCSLNNSFILKSSLLNSLNYFP